MGLRKAIASWARARRSSRTTSDTGRKTHDSASALASTQAEIDRLRAAALALPRETAGIKAVRTAQPEISEITDEEQATAIADEMIAAASEPHQDEQPQTFAQAPAIIIAGSRQSEAQRRAEVERRQRSMDLALRVGADELVHRQQETLGALDALRRSRAAAGGSGAPVQLPRHLAQEIVITDADLTGGESKRKGNRSLAEQAGGSAGE